MALKKLEELLPGRLKRSEWSWMVGYFSSNSIQKAAGGWPGSNYQQGWQKEYIIQQLYR